MLRDSEPSALEALVEETFRALVLSTGFTCLAAKSAIRSGNYRLGLHDGMDAPASALSVASDLERFVDDASSFGSGFRSYVASFDDVVARDEEQFEAALWRILQRLHDIDHVRHDWDPTVSADPSDPRFSFSFAGKAFFIVGMHPTSTRFARRFAWPTLVFNLHSQFDDLRAAGTFERMQTVIRARDVELQGNVNPNLADFGERSEARQYSGRATSPAWRCPFVPRGRKVVR